MVDVFVSYKSDDRERVKAIVEALETAGWEVWWDKHVEVGRAFDREIETAIDEAKCVLVVWSATSIDSDWVRNEASEGLDRNILVPVAIDDVRPPLAFRRQQTINFFAGASYDDVVKAVARLVPLEATAAKDVLPCVGRDREVGDLRRVLEAVRSGTGGTVFVGGEPGIGKTRLVREVKTEAIRLGFNVLTGHSRKEIALPYEPWIEQFEQVLRNISAEQVPRMFREHAAEVSFLLPKLQELVADIPPRVELPPEQERRFLMNGITDFLQKESVSSQPLVLIFEDLQWADESTCLLLQYLAGKIEDHRILILGTFRDAEMESTSPAAAMFQTLLRERLAEDVILRRLRRQEVVQMLHQLAGKAPPEELVDLVFKETEGNPFFVEEVFRHLVDLGKIFDDEGEFVSGIQLADTEVPRGVLMVIQNRLDRLSESCRAALTLAAVIGRVFPFRLLASSSDLDEDTLLGAIEEATAATLIEDLSSDREASYRFVHEQIRQTLLHTISFPRRQRMHIKIAEAMKQIKGRTIEIAHHLYAAGDAADPAETLAFLEKAIDEGLEALAFEDVLRVMDQAAELVDGEEAKAELARRRARALRGSNDIEGAAAVLTEAIAEVKDESLQTALYMEKITQLVESYRADASIEDLNMILSRARRNQDIKLELRAMLLMVQAKYQQSLDQPGKAKEWFDVVTETIDLARREEDQSALAQALMASSRALDYWPEKRGELSANVAEARQIAHATGDEGLEVEAQRLGLQMFTLDAREAELESENIRNRLVARRDPLKLKEYLFWMMWEMYALGRPKRSVEVATEDIELAAALGLPPVQYPTIRGLAYLELGRFADAEASIAEEVASDEYRFGRAFRTYGFAQCHYHLFDLDKAFGIIDDLIPELIALKRIWMIEVLMGIIGRDMMFLPDEWKTKAEGTFAKLVQSTVDDGGARKVPEGLTILQSGDLDQGIAYFDGEAQRLGKTSSRRLWVEYESVLQRLYLKAGRYDDLTALRDNLFAFVEHSAINRHYWQLLTRRAKGWLEVGAKDKSRTDALRAQECFDDVKATIMLDDQKAAFASQPTATLLSEVLDATS